MENSTQQAANVWGSLALDGRPSTAPVLDDCLSTDDPAVERLGRGRMEHLLGRGMQLSLAVEKWQARAIWVLSRADDDYPGRLKRSLGSGAPPILYGCGDRSVTRGDCSGLARP